LVHSRILTLTALAACLLTGNPARAEKVVMIGDSITCGPFGERMLTNLGRGGKNDVTVYCMEGSSAEHWLNGKTGSSACKTISSKNTSWSACRSKAPLLSKIVSENPGARFVIALGTNATVSTVQNKCQAKQEAANVEAKFAKFAQTLGRAKCDWVLPPHMNPSQTKGWPPCHVARMEKNLSSISGQIKTAVSSSDKHGTHCNTISSLDATASGTKGHQTRDGVHRTKEAGFYWADEIKGQLLNDGPETTEGPGEITLDAPATSAN
jgi:hypothetical protein